MGLGMFILIGREPVPESDLFTWATWLEESYENGQHWVACDDIGPLRVSTVFLGLDHGYGGLFGDKAPILFETMVLEFDGNDLAQRRYATWEEAERGHKVAVRYARLRLRSAKRLLWPAKVEEQP